MLWVISGQARAGKDTTAVVLKEIFTGIGESVISVAYADFLKEMLGKCFNLTSEQLYGSSKEAPIHNMPIRTRSGIETKHLWTPRKLLQFVGTDVMRTIDPDCWINVVKNFVATYSNYDNIIITDARFANEIDWVLERGGTHIHLTRENKDYASGTTHASETSLCGLDFVNSYVIQNDKDLLYLKAMLIEIINKEK